MTSRDSFCSSGSSENTRQKYQQRRLTLLRYWRDALERRIAAVDASINTLEDQIKRDEYRTK